jgi:hypothetical protein
MQLVVFCVNLFLRVFLFLVFNWNKIFETLLLIHIYNTLKIPFYACQIRGCQKQLAFEGQQIDTIHQKYMDAFRIQSFPELDYKAVPAELDHFDPLVDQSRKISSLARQYPFR